MITILAIILMTVGLGALLRTVLIITAGQAGRFPLDPLVSCVTGFGLVMLGRILLDL
jgi:hypothetical protein